MKLITKSSVQNKRDPFMSVDGILCGSGYLWHASVKQEQFRYPVILLKKDHIVDLIIKHVNESHGHVSREYWN